MYYSPAQRALGDIVKKIEAAERLTREDGLRLLLSEDLLSLGYMANIQRQRCNENLTYFLPNSVSETQSAEIDHKINATMLYGGTETYQDRIDYLLKLRKKQDENKEFQGFFPMANSNNITTGFEDLKILAVSRVILDNFPHIKTSLSFLGLKMTQVALTFGVDDIDGVVGIDAGQELTEHSLINMIKKAGYVPVQRDNMYNVIRRDF